MLTSDILQRAKQELLTRGWCQGTAQNERGEVCVMGAVMHAAGWQAEDSYDAIDVLGESLGWGWPVPIWNDRPDRTPEQVLAAVDAAIALAQSREAASVPAAVVDAPALVGARSCVPSRLDGGDRGKGPSTAFLISLLIPISEVERTIEDTERGQ